MASVHLTRSERESYDPGEWVRRVLLMILPGVAAIVILGLKIRGELPSHLSDVILTGLGIWLVPAAIRILRCPQYRLRRGKPLDPRGLGFPWKRNTGDPDLTNGMIIACATF